MKQAMQILLGLMFAAALGTAWMQGWEQAMLLLILFGFSARAYRLVRIYRQDADEAGYEKQMKVVQGLTVACALLSFYWPDSMYLNAGLFTCLIFHCVVNRYAKAAVA